MMNDKFTFGKAITAVPPPPFSPLYTHIGEYTKRYTHQVPFPTTDWLAASVAAVNREESPPPFLSFPPLNGHFKI